MPTRREIRAESMRRLGSYQTLTVSIDPDVSDAAAQRKVISTDLYSIDKTTTNLGQANLWCGRYDEGNKVRTNSYLALAKAVLTPPVGGSGYTLRLYGYGTTGTIANGSSAAAVQVLVRAASASLATATVVGSGPTLLAVPYTITLPSASITIEIVRLTTGDTTGSVTQGLASVDTIRPWTVGLPAGTQVELLAKYPAHDEAGLIGMNKLIDQALARLWFVDLLHFTSTDANSDQVTFSLGAYPWLKSRSQILRVYAPTTWTHTASYTVPLSSHTVSINVGFAAVITTASLEASASASAIQDAIRSSFSANGVVGTVTVEASGTTRTVTIANAVYADLALTVSTAPTITATVERTLPLRFADSYRLKYDANELTLEWDYSMNRGYTWFMEVYRPAHTLICAQTDYQTLGTTWAASDTGPANDLDQVVPDLHEVASMVHYLACRQLALYGPGQESKFWRDEQKRAAFIAAYLKSLDLPKSGEPGFNDQGVSPVRGAASKNFFAS